MLLHIPGFQPEEARRAPWVLKGGLIDPTVGQALGLETDLAGADGGGVHHRGREMGEGSGARAGQEQKQTTGVKQPSWKGRRRERLLASGVVEEREVFRDPTGDRGCEEERGMEAMDSIQNFLSVNFPDVPREVRAGDEEHVWKGEGGEQGNSRQPSTVVKCVTGWCFISSMACLSHLPSFR